MSGYDLCKCRPGCLAHIERGDDVVLADEGYALTEHVFEAYPGEQLAIDIEVAS